MISWVIVIAIIVAGTALAITSTQPALKQIETSIQITNAEQAMNRLYDAITSVRSEGIGSSRVIAIPGGDWKSLPASDQIELRIATDTMEPGTRKIADKISWIAGPEANCYEGSWKGKAAFVLENSFVKVYLSKVNGTLNTTQNIMAMTSKTTNKTIEPTDSSVIIDSNTDSSTGTGFSEMRIGNNQASCRTHFFIDSVPFDYDIFYTLYSAADFLVAEVRNIN
jgi:hypothetical protein